METKDKNISKKGFHLSAALVIVACFITACLIFIFVFGNSSNFVNNDPNNQPLPGNLLGTIYKGGLIVPVIQTLLLTVLVLSVERWFAIKKAKGNGSLVNFVQNIKSALQSGDIEKAEKICNDQKGSVANVVKSSLTKYKEMSENNELTKEQKIANIQKEVEEATSLELPSLEQNLGVVATITTLGTLMGLLGTVVGMSDHLPLWPIQVLPTQSPCQQVFQKH